MNQEGKRRPPRIPKTPEEVAELILMKRLREYKKLEKFKSSLYYKGFNIFCLICFFIYIELIICFIGPCNYRNHVIKKISYDYGDKVIGSERIISMIKIISLEGRPYEFVVNEFIEPPVAGASFEVGRDFLLRKEIKGSLYPSGSVYRLHRASPILFLSFFVAVFSCIFFSYNLNQNPHSLRAITVINAMTIFGFLVI